MYANCDYTMKASSERLTVGLNAREYGTLLAYLDKTIGICAPSELQPVLFAIRDTMLEVLESE